MTTAQDTFKKCSPWMRLSICINIHVKKALIDVLHNHIRDRQVQGLPYDPTGLYAFLQTNKRKIQNSTVIKEQQKSILLPASVQTVNSSSFDVSLTRFLIQTFCGIRNAKGNWTKPDRTDQTICAYVYRAAAMRNAICHDNNIEEMNATEFEKKWKDLEEILKGLKYAEDIGPFKKEELNITKYKDVILEEFNDYLRSYKEECKKEKSQDNYIERRFAVDGNENDIVTESDFERLLQDNDCVVIHGEAGMGKSSTAKRLKNEWCNGNVFDNQNIIYYDSKRMNKQLKYKSNAAALAFSEMRDHLTEKRGTIEVDDLSIFYCVQTIFDNLIIVIDGIDEFPIEENITGDYVDKLERKVLENEKISGAETIIAIYLGHLFPRSKVILLGRNGEFESLKKVEWKGNAAIFNRRTKNLELLKFDAANIKEFSCLKICKQPSQQSTCTGPCQEIHRKIKNIELCKNPTDLNSLIELQNTNNKHPNEVIGNITRTKLLIATIFNRLTNHIKHQNNYTVKTFLEIGKQNDFSKYFQCIRTLGEVSFKSLLKNNVTVRVEKEIDGIYFEDENKNKIRIERETLEELDLFYVRDLDYYFELEPHHTLNIEYLCGCYLFSHPEESESILKLNEDRQLEIIKFIAGLHADDCFTKDFVKNVLNIPDYSLEQFFSWLYNVEDVRWSLPDGGYGYDRWFGLMETQKLSPSFYLLDSISQEVEIPQTFIPTTIVCYRHSFEWFNLCYLKHNLLTKLSDILNIELFLEKFSDFKFIIKGDIEINDNDEFNRVDQYGANNLIIFRINTLYIYTPLDTSFSSHFNVNTLYIGEDCDSRMIDMMLNALSPPPTNTSSSNIQPTMKCKRLDIHHILPRFNSQQTEKLFELCLCGVVDYIKLRYKFFTDGQLAILEKVERKTNTLINIELWYVKLVWMFVLPNLGKRHINLNYVTNVTDNDLIKLRNHIPPGYCDNFNDYKIINARVPFVRKENYSRDCKQSMFLNLYEVNFTAVSPEVFANTFSIIPSLSCEDNYRIPSSHWLRLSQIDDCRINEMRIWTPQSENFQHFVNIKTRVSQFICDNKDDLKQLLDYIVNNQDIQFDKQIKVFVVKVDLDGDWDYYDEITLFSGKTIGEYKDDCSSDNSLFDNIPVSFHDGEQHLKWWCCEISSSRRKDNNLWLWLGLGLALGLGLLSKYRSMRQQLS